MNTSRPLRIVMVHERFPPDYGGGGEYVVLQIAKHLIALGHEVKVVTTGDPAHSHFEGVSLLRLPISRYRLNAAYKTVAKEAQDADVIHAFTYHAAYPAHCAGRALGKPVVLGVLALFGQAWLEMRGPLVGRLFQRFESYLLQLPFAQRVFLSAGSLALAGPSPRPSDCIIAPGISLQDYRADPQKDGIVFSGKLDSRKGIDVVQAMARALPHIPFTVVGWGDEFDEVVRNSPPNMSVQRFVDRAQLAQVLARARIFLFPSKAETFGLVVAEAMASGCAVVGQAPLEFEGVRVDPSDGLAMRQALESLWNDLERCRACGQRNQVLAQAYSWQQHMAQLVPLYEGLLGLASNPAIPVKESDSSL